MLKIIINARFLTQPITGVQRYAIELVKALDALLESGELDKTQVSYILLAPKGTCHELNLNNIPLKQVGILRGHLWEQIELPLYSHGQFLLNLCNTGPLIKHNQIVTICDASVFACPAGYSKAFRLWYQFLLPILCRNAKKIITISEFSKSELVKYCGGMADKISPILLGVDNFSRIDVDKTILDKHALGTTPYVLAVSSMNPNKNFAAFAQAIEILEEVNFKVVIAGGANSKVFGRNAAQLPNFVIQVGYVSDAELHALYNHADCFVFPSLYEGFGLPPLEAMACGCPAIVSNAASLPEVCGDAALYCDPYNPADIAEKIKRIMNDAEMREDLRKKGLARAHQFTWKKCARETYVVIEEALE